MPNEAHMPNRGERGESAVVWQVAPGLRDYTGMVGGDDPEFVDMAYRVVADHIRTLTFAITDGAVPSNEGRGYVLRRILRRAVRYGGEILKAPEGFFHQLVDVVVEVMAGAFPELAKNPANVKAILKEEEEIFSKTLKRGIAELTKRCAKLEAGGTLPGEDAFRMYDTYGFPVDLTVLMCEEKGFQVTSLHGRVGEVGWRDGPRLPVLCCAMPCCAVRCRAVPWCSVLTVLAFAA